MVFDKICEFISEQFGIEEDDITLETSFKTDLNADSLDMVEIMMVLEEEFDIGEIDDETAAGIETVGDVVNLIQSMI
jgi:acyl carrier protein